MKIKQLLPVALLGTLALFSCEQKEKKQEFTHDFDIVESAVGEVYQYTLENGIKVYLKVNKDKPEISTNIAFKVGSKNDPKDYTGLAHYLEHMLFKGTSKLGSINWEKEKVLLDSIAALYEAHHDEQDLAKRKEIYAQIDKVSVEAAKFASANEYDKLLTTLGASGTNAYTSNEQTVYVNTIPTASLDKWMKIESERFQELVLRLFHTELEAVYEEYNMSLDRDGSQVYQKLWANLFPTHQYGQQTTIGKGEHLKAPSLVQIQQFFNTYYVPNNMGIVMVGDLDPDKTVDMIEKYFGDYKRKELPAFEVIKEAPLTTKTELEVVGKERESFMLGYRITPKNQKEEDILSMLDQVFSNGKTGIIDLNLVKEQKVQSAYAYFYNMNDYGIFGLGGVPNPNQKLEETKDLVLAQLDSLKQGKFPDWMLDAIIKNMKKDELTYSEYSWFFTSTLTDVFIGDKDLNTELNSINRLSNITKKDIVDFANTYLSDENYVVVYKRQGEPNNIKVEKPEITQVSLNQDTSSAFFKEVMAMEETRLTPEFPDYSEVKFENLTKNVEYATAESDLDDLFSLEYIVEIGEKHDLKLPIAVNYSQYLGTDSLSAKELEQAFYKLGVDFYVYAGDDRSYLGISGLKESFEPAVKLFEHFLQDVKADQDVYDNFASQEIKKRADNKKNKNYLRYAGSQYAKYGPFNPLTNIVKSEELKALDVTRLTSSVKQFSAYKHIVNLVANDTDGEMKKVIEKYHTIPSTMLPIPEEISYEVKDTKENKVYFVQYDMVQGFIGFQSKGAPYNEDLLAPTRVFNKYFGSGLSSIVFQEIRESKALAYSSYAYFGAPDNVKKHHSLGAFIGTQGDKVPDAVPAMMELLNNVPVVEKQINESIEGALKQIETSRTKKSSLIYGLLYARKMGRDKSVNEIVYEQIKNMKTEDLQKFFKENIEGKAYNFTIVGDKEKLDMDYIKSLGDFKELTIEEIFGE